MNAAAWALVLLAGTSPAPPERRQVPDARPLMLEALQASDGQAHGALDGELARAITHRFEASGPIYIDVTTAHRYAQAGCARLNVVIWQDGVKLPDAPAPQTQRIEFGINYCLDGRPPKSLERRP